MIGAEWNGLMRRAGTSGAAKKVEMRITKRGIHGEGRLQRKKCT